VIFLKISHWNIILFLYREIYEKIFTFFYIKSNGENIFICLFRKLEIIVAKNHPSGAVLQLLKGDVIPFAFNP